jgi:glycosyltransferase involved in cell wall biosynthesis
MIHYAAAPVVGGVENVMRQHARLLVAAGNRVRIVAGRGRQIDAGVEFTSLALADSQNPEVLTAKSELDAGRVPPAFELLAEKIEQQLRRVLDGADWLVCHNVCSLNKNLALTAAIHRVSESHRLPRLILWHHDLAWTTPRYRKELHDGFPWSLLRTDWPQATQVVVSAQRQAELAGLLGVRADRIRVVPNGVDVVQFLALGAQTQALLRDFGLLEALPLILLPVRITPRKNIELALMIVSSLRTRFPDTRLLVTGPVGPHNPSNVEYLQRLLALRQDLGLENAAVFVTEATGGSLPDEAVAELYRLADLLLLPSVEEGFGLPVLEAGLAGLPIFCSNLASLNEPGGGEVTYFEPESDATNVARQIASALEVSRRFALRHRILREHTWERIYSRHLAPLLEGR